MKCVVCRFGEVAPGTTTYNLNSEVMTLVVKEVPADVCDACGEGYLAPEVSTQLHDIVEDAKKAGVEFMVRKYAPAEVAQIQACFESEDSESTKVNQKVNGIHRHPVDRFIEKLELAHDQYTRKEHASGYQLYINTPTKRQPRFGYVRLNKTGSRAGMMTVYAIGDSTDPLERFQSQPKNDKDRVYWFWPDDEEAMSYAARVVKSAYESKL